MSEGGRKGSSRKLSRVSAQEKEELDNALLNFFKKFCQGEDGMSSSQLQCFAQECNLCDKKMTEGDVLMVFQSVKLGKKDAINFDRFQVGVWLPISLLNCHLLGRKQPGRWQFKRK